jgi:hypothetical protein
MGLPCDPCLSQDMRYNRPLEPHEVWPSDVSNICPCDNASLEYARARFLCDHGLSG